MLTYKADGFGYYSMVMFFTFIIRWGCLLSKYGLQKASFFETISVLNVSEFQWIFFLGTIITIITMPVIFEVMNTIILIVRMDYIKKHDK